MSKKETGAFNKNKRRNLVVALYFGIFLFFGSKISSWNSSEANATVSSKEVWINVFVHGIMSIKPHISWNNFMLFLKDRIEGTLYEKTVELMREDPFFYKNQAMQQIGFHQVNPQLFEGNSSASLAFILEKVGKHYGIKQNNHYYTFGWSGLLSSKSRYNDAKKLFLSLKSETDQLKQRGLQPRIRVIGYSHGGNVSLNLAAVKKQEFKNTNLAIDELLLLGTPIISDTDHLVNDDIFKCVFNFYSLCDRVQPLDFFAPKQIFSDRIFKPRKGFDLPNKLIQVQLKVTRCKESVLNCPKKFDLSHDFKRTAIVYGKSGLLRDISPGHAELWFFGWTPVFYRKNYPLYPLPTISFAPVIMNHARKIAQSLTPEHSIIADIRPQHNVILFRPNNDHHVHSTVPFMPRNKLKKLHDAVLKCKPNLYSTEIYRAHIQDAARNAQQILDLSRKD